MSEEIIDLQWISRRLIAIQEDVHSIKDQLFVQGSILLRLEQRDRGDNETLALLQRIHRLERRIAALEAATAAQR